MILVFDVSVERRHAGCFPNRFAVVRRLLWLKTAVPALVRTTLRKRLFLDFLSFNLTVVLCLLREEAAVATLVRTPAKLILAGVRICETMTASI